MNTNSLSVTKILLALLTTVTLFSAAAAELDVEEDYRSELPRIAPIEPQDSLAQFTIADGYRIELVAHEPTVTDPVAFDFDEWGRLFVVEMRGYSEHAQDQLGSVRLLTDSNGDGKYDQSTLYADKLSWPTAVVCYDGGVFIGVAPDILYCKDTDGDGRADLRQTVFTGFGTSNVQGLLNSFRWGLDNRIHGATSSSGGSVRRVDQPESAAMTLRGRDFSFDPRTLELRAESGGGQHGMCFDRWGRKFVCSNSDHLQAVLIADRYIANNPYYALPRARESIASDGPQAAVFRTSPVEPWRIVRTRLRVAGAIPGPVEGGGTAAGYFTSATGVTIYEGDDWPEDQRGAIAIVGDVGSNIVHRKRLTSVGASFRGDRIVGGTEFLASRDIWFRPVQFACGPDGGLYIADMYREVIEHPDSLAPIIKKHLDLDSGRDRGRIYRILSADSPGRPRVWPGEVSTSELVTLLAHRNIWHRQTASRLLYQRSDLSVVPALRDMAIDSARTPESRVHAGAALQSLNRLTDDIVVSLTTDSQPRLREAGVWLAESLLAAESLLPVGAVRTEDTRPIDGDLPEALAHAAADPDPRVRFQLALTLSCWQGEREREEPNWKDKALHRLLRTAGDDPWLQAACLVASADFLDFDTRLRAADSDLNSDLRKSLMAIVAERTRDDWQAITQPANQTLLTTVPPVRHLPSNQETIDRYTQALSPTGSPSRGQQLFTDHCGTCHGLRPSDKSLGPTMSAIRARGAAAIIMNVLDPNREIHPQYVNYTAETDDGQLVSGIIASETATSITLAREIQQQTTLLKTRLESLQSNGKSIMPEGLEQKISPTQMNDLLAFILQLE